MTRHSAEGARFKALERSMRTRLYPGVPGVIRLDGRAFHNYTKGLDRPYDQTFMADMDNVAATLVKQIDGVALAYVQSDEISLLLVDQVQSCDGVRERGFMFDGAVQKLVSIGAAIASSELNARRYGRTSDRLALFDARAFSVADPDEARDYFVWRQDDARVNSVSMLASAHFSHRQLHGKSTSERVRMLEESGFDPTALPDGFRHGRVITKSVRDVELTYTDKRTSQTHSTRVKRSFYEPAAAGDFRTEGFDEALLLALAPSIPRPTALELAVAHPLLDFG